MKYPVLGDTPDRSGNYLSSIRHHVPVAPREGVFATADPSQDFLRGIIRSTGEGCESVGSESFGLKNRCFVEPNF